MPKRICESEAEVRAVVALLHLAEDRVRRVGDAGSSKARDGGGERPTRARCRRARRPAPRRSARTRRAPARPIREAPPSDSFCPSAALARALARRPAACCVRWPRSRAAYRADYRSAGSAGGRRPGTDIVSRGDADGGERIEVHRADLDVLHATLAQGVQRPLAREDDALRADGAVELILDLQQARGELAILVAFAGCRWPRTPDGVWSARHRARRCSLRGRCSSRRVSLALR